MDGGYLIPDGVPPGENAPMLTLLFAIAAAPAWAGVYVGADGKSTAALVVSGDDVWWMDRDVRRVRVSARSDVEPLGGHLTHDARGWRLRIGKREHRQLVDPLRIDWSGTRAFADVDGHGRLVIRDGLLIALDVPKQRCIAALLRPDPSVAGERKVPARLAAPKAGALGVRAFLLLELAVACGEPLPRDVESQGLVAGAYVFARADATPVAVELVGYMYVQVFVAEGTTAAERQQILRAASEELGHQAE